MYFMGEMGLIFLSSRLLLRNLSLWVGRVTGDYEKTVRFIATLFLPGTALHEMAHYLVASMLGVAVGEIDLVPRLADGQLKLGSVEIGRMDPVRKLLVCGAPLLVGMGVVLGVLYVESVWEVGLYGDLAVGYVVFQVSNTMFMSRRDMEAVWEFLLLIVIAVVILYLVGFRVTVGEVVEWVERGKDLGAVNELLWIPIVINLGLFVGVRGLRYL
jgi:hypothetical protein